MQRSLGLITAISLVIGCMIGTGVFMKPAAMATQAGSAPMVLLAWLVAGLLSLAGALTYAELTSRMPAAGGEYAILKNVYGEFPAYLYGWMRFTIGAPGSAASYAVGAAMFLQVVYPYQVHGLRVWQVAVFFVLFFTVINTLTILVSASVQVILTAVKVVCLVAIVVTLVLLTPPHAGAAPPVVWPGMVSFSAALMAALWAYDGWNNLPMLGGEVRNARRNLPLALTIGMISVIFIYLAVNFSFFRVLRFDEVLAMNPLQFPGAQPVATAAMAKSISGASVKVIAALLVISALGAMNGSILASARVPYAMAKDGIFFAALGRLSQKNSIPVVATLVQGSIAALLAMSGTFDELTDSVVFASWLFYGLTAATVFKLRSMPAAITTSPGFKVPFYPLLPALFLICSAAFLVYAIIALPYLTALGSALIALGIPVYFWVKRPSKQTI